MKCRVKGCHRDAKCKESRLCTTCYAFMNYWKDKTVTHRMKRVDQLEFWERRAKQLLVPAKVAKRRISRS